MWGRGLSGQGMRQRRLGERGWAGWALLCCMHSSIGGGRASIGLCTFAKLPWSQWQRGRMRSAMHTRAHLATLNSHIYEVNVAASKCSRPADTCSDVENRNSGREQDLGRESTTERWSYPTAHARAHLDTPYTQP
jgi:hypothetical protein